MDDSNYLPQLPLAHDETDGRLDTFMNRSIKRFLTTFYEVSDDATQNDTWLGFFDDDATVTMGMQTAKGSDGIAELRRGMWDKVAKRHHRIQKVFPSEFADSNLVDHRAVEYMLFGSVTLDMKTGEVKTVDWAAHARIRWDKPQGEWKLTFYRVYLQT